MILKQSVKNGRNLSEDKKTNPSKNVTLLSVQKSEQKRTFTFKRKFSEKLKFKMCKVIKVEIDGRPETVLPIRKKQRRS